MAITTNFYSLPNDIIGIIGSFLEGKDLLNFNSVCNRFYVVFTEMALYKSLRIAIRNDLFKEIYKPYFQDCPNQPPNDNLLPGRLILRLQDNKGFISYGSEKIDPTLLNAKIKIFLRNKTNEHENNPEELNKAYSLAHEKIIQLNEQVRENGYIRSISRFVRNNHQLILSIASICLVSWIRRHA